ncbi:MAG TPA: cysteine--tRNA ligase [Terriglobales bacterium]|nr:cysteine--tRNA ligase [Terriglobales bacterium]
MEILLYNTLTRRLEPLVAGDGRRFRMYTCGLTVYDYGHIGNYRTFVAVDVLQRFLASQGFALETVMNITDVDDKMIERARTAGHSVAEHAAIYTQAFLEDLGRLGIQPPTHLAKATDYVPQMVAWIERLVDSGHAYASDGSVYFRVASFPAYGRLSGKDLGGLQAGARVESDQYEKEEARDFVLWKAHKPGEPSWPSPWGPGRPGWHIECSVMSMTLLGESFDLHAGGTDLIFPHHENEIAQAEAVTGRPFVRGWMHVEFLLVNGEKMSKSLGNFFTLRDLLDQGYRASAVRYLLASVPYRRQLNFTLEGLQQAAAAVERLMSLRDRLRQGGLAAGEDAELAAKITAARAGYVAALADNLNTAEALAAIFELVREANIALDAGRLRAANATACEELLHLFDQVFAVLTLAEREKMEASAGLDPATIEARLRERDEARRRRDFRRADAIRAELDAAGIAIEDVKGGGSRWRRK